MSTSEYLKNLSKAGANLLHVASYEWERVRGIIIGLSGELAIPLHVWSQSTGVKDYDKKEETFTDKSELVDPLEMLKSIHGSKEAGIWLLEDFHPFLREGEHQLIRWLRELARLPSSPRKLVVLSTPTPGLAMDLQKEIPTVELELPGVDHLRVVLEEASRNAGLRCPAKIEDEVLLEAARGLTVMEATLAFGKAAAEHGRLDHSAVPLVAREKERIIKQSGVLEYYPTDISMSAVGGLDQLKEWLVRRGRPWRTDTQRRTARRPCARAVRRNLGARGSVRAGEWQRVTGP